MVSGDFDVTKVSFDFDVESWFSARVGQFSKPNILWRYLIYKFYWNYRKQIEKYTYPIFFGFTYIFLKISLMKYCKIYDQIERNTIKWLNGKHLTRIRWSDDNNFGTCRSLVADSVVKWKRKSLGRRYEIQVQDYILSITDGYYVNKISKYKDISQLLNKFHH